MGRRNLHGWRETGHRDFPAYLAGYAAYVHMVDPVLGKRYRDEVAKLIGDSNG